VKAFGAIGIVVMLAGCGGPPPVLFDGLNIKAKVASTSDDKRDITVAVTGAADKAGSAVKAVRYEATKYCMKNFAGSDVIWSDGVLQDAKTLLTPDGSLVRQGRCVQR
jgi:hypothetical protein